MKVGGRKTVAVTGICYIHHPALPVQYHCLPLWIQIQFIQGHISSSWASECSWTQGLYPPWCWHFCVPVFISFSPTHLWQLILNAKNPAQKQNPNPNPKPLNRLLAAILCWLMWNIYLRFIHKCFSWLKYVNCHLSADGRLLFPPATFNIYIFQWHQHAEWRDRAPCSLEESFLSSSTEPTTRSVFKHFCEARGCFTSPGPLLPRYNQVQPTGTLHCPSSTMSLLMLLCKLTPSSTCSSNHQPIPDGPPEMDERIRDSHIPFLFQQVPLADLGVDGSAAWLKKPPRWPARWARWRTEPTSATGTPDRGNNRWCSVGDWSIFLRKQQKKKKTVYIIVKFNSHTL